MSENRNNIETEYLKLNEKNDWPALFQNIVSQSSKFKGTSVEALKPQNKILNRYRDINPYDHSRIVLKRGTTDYINANLVTCEKANRKYILTQGPLSNTVSHFWLMIWEQKSVAVLMLNKLIEKKQEKCHQYWPSKIGPDHIMKMSDVNLSLEYLSQQDFSYYLTRTFKLTDLESGESLEILHFHYTTWPDFGVPSSPNAFLEFLQRVRKAGALEENVGPAVIHCSAGVGRSGTFCLVDTCLILIEKCGYNSVDVKDVLLEMRRHRMGLIQTPEQLRFSYQAIIEGANQILNPGSHNTESQIVISSNNQQDAEENNVSSASTSDTEEDDEPPPLPPPRSESLANRANGSPIDRPLPTIPNSESVGDFDCDKEQNDYIPSGPLPIVPSGEGSSEDELEDTDDESLNGSKRSKNSDKETEQNSGDSHLVNNTQSDSSDLRHRKRVEKKEQMAAQVRDMKRRQQQNEQWTQLKRSLFKPFVIGTLVLGGGLVAYLYFRH